MPRRIWSDGQEVLDGDLSAGSASLEIELYDRIIYEILDRQTSFMFGDSFIVSYINSSTVQVKAGNGFYNDGSQVDPECKNRALYVAANTNKSVTTPDPSQNRIDIICITPARAVIQTATRNYKDPSSGAVAPTTFNIETDWVSTLSVVAGTPSGSPVAPATPAGSVKLAEVLVTASTGISGSSAVTDKRIRYKKPTGTVATRSVSAAATADVDDGVILANAAGGAFSVTLPPVASSSGKRLVIKKIDSSGNAVTVQANAAEIIDGVNTQVISAQYTTIAVICDGSAWYLV